MFNRSADRNKSYVAAVLVKYLSKSFHGTILDIAAGTGQHASYLASVLPKASFYPVEYDRTRFPIIQKWASLGNLYRKVNKQVDYSKYLDTSEDMKERFGGVMQVRYPPMDDKDLEGGPVNDDFAPASEDGKQAAKWPEADEEGGYGDRIHEAVFADMTSRNAAVDLDKELGKSTAQKDSFDCVLNINMIHISPFETCTGLMQCGQHFLKDDGYLMLYGPFNVGGDFTTPSNARFNKWLLSKADHNGIRDLEKVVAIAKKHGLSLVEVGHVPANNMILVFQKVKSVKSVPEQKL